jgi:hypothetical protein
MICDGGFLIVSYHVVLFAAREGILLLPMYSPCIILFNSLIPTHPAALEILKQKAIATEDIGSIICVLALSQILRVITCFKIFILT